MNLTDIFALLGPLDHKVKSVYAFTWNKLQDNFLRGAASSFTKYTVGCPIEIAGSKRFVSEAKIQTAVFERPLRGNEEKF